MSLYEGTIHVIYLEKGNINFLNISKCMYKYLNNIQKQLHGRSQNDYKVTHTKGRQLHCKTNSDYHQ